MLFRQKKICFAIMITQTAKQMQEFLSFRFLHPVRCGEAQHIDTGFHNFFGQYQKGNQTLFSLLILFRQNSGFMVEAVEGVCQVVDVSANLVGRQFGSRTLHGALEARKLHHQGKHTAFKVTVTVHLTSFPAE